MTYAEADALLQKRCRMHRTLGTHVKLLRITRSNGEDEFVIRRWHEDLITIRKNGDYVLSASLPLDSRQCTVFYKNLPDIFRVERNYRGWSRQCNRGDRVEVPDFDIEVPFINGMVLTPNRILLPKEVRNGRGKRNKVN